MKDLLNNAKVVEALKSMERMLTGDVHTKHERIKLLEKVLLDVRLEGPETDPCWCAISAYPEGHPHEPCCQTARLALKIGSSR